MNMNQSLTRKITYVVGIALLLFPLFRLGQPATSEHAGGKLAQLREEHNLSQNRIGEIDPVSEAIKLATLGMRGIAVVVMWDKASEYKKKEDFDNFRLTLEQLTKLAPNFLTFWEFQAHNISYNTSVEYDGYLDRYRWVKDGIKFIIQGTRYNRNQPRLLYNVGWYLGHKLGTSDEKRQFRALFRKDTDFHKMLRENGIDIDVARGPKGEPDNWLVSNLWFKKAEQAMEGRSIVGGVLTPLLLFSYGPRSLMNFAKALEEDGQFDDQTRAAYVRALDAWNQYGEREIYTPFGHNIVLNDLPQIRRELRDYRKRLISFDEKMVERIRARRTLELPPEVQDALNEAPANRTEMQKELARGAEVELAPSIADLIQEVPKARRDEAAELARAARIKETMLQRVESSSQRVNFYYWRARCQVEQTQDAIDAKKAVNDATRLFRSAKLQEARTKYEEAWTIWDKIFNEHKALELEKDELADSLMASFRNYFSLLEQLEAAEIPPKDFKLMRLLQHHDLNPNPPARPDKNLFQKFYGKGN